MLSWANSDEVQQGGADAPPLALVSGQLRLTSGERPVKSECCIWCHSSPGASRRSFCRGRPGAVERSITRESTTLSPVSSAGSRRDSDQSGAVTHPPAALQNTIGHISQPFQRQNENRGTMVAVRTSVPRP